jgi:tetratricopeptide (TPR) repeat protein
VPQLPLAVLAVLTLLPQARGIEPAEEAYAEAVRLLAQDEASAAEAAARRALAESSLFVPEREIEVAPEKGLVFEEMIEAARTAYRERRARYFRALGLALTAEERWPEARKALRRSAGLQPTAEIFAAMASHPDIPIEERVDLLVRAYFAPGADQSGIERALLETGAFASGEALQAVVDRERFSRELAAEFPNVEVVVAPLPDVRVATSTGTFVAADLLAEGAVVVLYLPVAGCNRCSEELEGIRRGLGEWNRAAEVEFVVGAFVDEQDLEDARRIVRLLGMLIEVGRVDRIPAGIRPASGGEIVMVARRGVMQIRIPLDEDSSSRVVAEQVAAVAGLLMEQQPASEARPPLGPAQSDRGRKALAGLIDRAVVLEAGPVPIPNVYEEIDREVRQLLQEATREDATSVLAELTRLRGAGEAKARALLALDKTLPETLLAAVKEMAPEVLRQAPPEEGVFYVGLTDLSDVSANRRVLLQRTFLEGDALRHFDLVVDLNAAGASPVWVGPEPDEPTGTRLVSTSAVFFMARDGCRGLRLVGEQGPVYEGCPAHLRDGEVVEEIDVLMEKAPPADGPRFYRRRPIDSAQPTPPETALEQGIRLFRDGSYRDAIPMFEQAMREIDPVAPYDETDVRYNIARCYQELGEGPRALQVMETIGDAAYQDLVEKRIHELAVATRR